MSERQTPFDMFGIECGIGWKDLYQPIMDLATLYGCRVAQVKEKFGGLRIYLDGPRARELDSLVTAAELISLETCEDCGLRAYRYDMEQQRTVPVVTRDSPMVGWMRSLCPACRQTWEASRG